MAEYAPEFLPWYTLVPSPVPATRDPEDRLFLRHGAKEPDLGRHRASEGEPRVSNPTELDPSAARLADMVTVLQLFAEADLHEQLFWRCDGLFAPVTFFVVITDLFEPQSADLEEISRHNLADLQRAFLDVREVTGGDVTYAPALFVARNRLQRPYGGAYPSDRRLWPLFDAAGPLRPKEIGVDRLAAPAAAPPAVPASDPVPAPASAQLPPQTSAPQTSVNAAEGWPALPDVLPTLKE